VSSRHLIDPEILPLLDLLPPLDFGENTDLPAMRARSNAAVAQLPPPPLQPKRAAAPGRDGAPDVPLLLFDPPGRTSRAAILQIHGGGMVMGTVASSSHTNAALAQALGILIVAVDYRLAPETPFPGPQQDCVAAFDWLVAHAAQHGVDPARIALLGDSAGGGLAASTALILRDRRGVQPAAQVLIYPMLDHRTGAAQHPALAFTGEFVWTAQANQYGWAALRGDYGADDERAGWFSPALAADLAGLPPTFIAVGALDLYLEEDLDYARRLIGAGVPAELHLYAGAFHAFDKVPAARVSQAFLRDLHAGLTRLLAL
jgi:triacylglycerol lipase